MKNQDKNFPTEAHKMRQVGEILKQQLPDLGWALLVFEFNSKNPANYISNAQRADMIKFLRETLERFEKQQDFSTPEAN
jgi:hypothetical protein